LIFFNIFLKKKKKKQLIEELRISIWDCSFMKDNRKDKRTTWNCSN
jgi:hypothetical protein